MLAVLQSTRSLRFTRPGRLLPWMGPALRGLLALAFKQVLTAYRRHHADLLFHLSDRELFQPFFLARVIEERQDFWIVT